MKKRIIALVLVVVMAVMALVSCGSYVFNYASEDLTKYATFKESKFFELLGAIEIEDSDFTTDDAVRDQKVMEEIYNTLTDKLIAYGDNKVVNGLIGERDIVYYAYYATVVKGSTTHTIFYDQMEEALIDSSTTSIKKDHFIELGRTSTIDNELEKAFRDNLAAALTGKTLSEAYATVSQKGESLKSLSNGTKLVISYKVDTVDGEGNPSSKTINYEVVSVGDTNALLTEVLKEAYGNTIGNTATFADGKKTFEVKEGDNTHTYSNVVVKWKVASDPSAALASFTMKRYDTTKTVYDVNNTPVDLNGLDITYYVYPVSIIHVPEFDGKSVLQYILGSSVKATSLDIFEDETYTVVSGEKLPELIEELVKIYAGTTEKNTAVKDAKKAYDSAKAVVDTKGDEATPKQKETLEKATKKLADAKKTESVKAIEKILTATSTTTGAKPLAEAIAEEYRADLKHSKTETYNTEIIQKIAKKVYAAIEESVEIIKYPEAALKEACDRIYEAYEYAFYNDKHSTADNASSEYSEHKGEFVNYLTDCALKDKVKEVDGDIWKGINAAIEKEAKAQLAPIIKVYVVAKALNLDSATKTNLLAWAELDKTAGRFMTEVDRDDYDTDAEYNEAVKNAEEAATKSYENAKKEADRFLVTDAVFDQYKKDVGNASYESFVSTYGEVNLRMALQFEKLMSYLTSINTEKDDEGHTHPKYVDRDGDGTLYIDFRYSKLKYTTAEDDADGGSDE